MGKRREKGKRGKDTEEEKRGKNGVGVEEEGWRMGREGRSAWDRKTERKGSGKVGREVRSERKRMMESEDRMDVKGVNK